KWKNEPGSGGKKIGPKRDLVCRLCKDYRSPSLNAFAQHLRKKHKTTPKELGIAFKCDCGNEAQSSGHRFTSQCRLQNFTIFRKNRVEPPSAHKCVLCETRPSTVQGYIVHLRSRHEHSLGKVFI
ncbi:hypothetical protein PFISCL1PPCAC_22551, partial [Pristionchus fissidentatus]